MTAIKENCRIKIIICVCTFLIVYAMFEDWLNRWQIYAVGVIQILVTNWPDCAYMIAFGSMYTRNADDELGGTFVSFMQSI